MFLAPGDLPGPAPRGLGTRVGQARWARTYLNPRRNRAGVSRSAVAGFSQGRRRSAVSGRASRSWVWATTRIQVQRSAASGVRSFGVVRPRICFAKRKGVLQIEAAEKFLPETVYVVRGCASLGGP